MLHEPAPAPSPPHGRRALPSWGLLLALALFLLGVCWRFYYLYQVHPAHRFIYSDMESYVNMAMHFLSDSHTFVIGDAFYPPGTGLYLAALYSLDKSWSLAIAVQGILSSLIPLLLAVIGYELFGRRVALLALAGASLYFPFIDYASYFLSENPFIFTLLLSFWLMLRSLRVRNPVWAGVLGLLSGLVLGTAAAFKSVILLGGLLTALFLGYLGWRRRWPRVWLVFATGALGLLAVLAPLAVRATRLNEGRFCLISNNGPLSFLQGHYGRVGHFKFKDEKRGYYYEWGSPAALQYGFEKEATFPFGPYDTDQVSRAAWEWIGEHPFAALQLSVQHVFTLFAGTIPWPSSHTDERPWAIFFQQLFLFFILFPACVHLLRQARGIYRLERAALGDILVLLPVLGIMLTAFATIGDPRYRIPFDGFIILLAARGYVRTPAREDGLLPCDPPEGGVLGSTGSPSDQPASAGLAPAELPSPRGLA